MSNSFYKYVSSIDSDCGQAAKSLYEQVCSDVNPKQIIPQPRTCTDELDENEYFDKQTVSDEVLAKSHAAKQGAKAAVYPDAGRTSLGIMGTGFPQNVSADTSTASS
jgi:hypothetical protein